MWKEVICYDICMNFLLTRWVFEFTTLCNLSMSWVHPENLNCIIPTSTWVSISLSLGFWFQISIFWSSSPLTLIRWSLIYSQTLFLQSLEGIWVHEIFNECISKVLGFVKLKTKPQLCLLFNSLSYVDHGWEPCQASFWFLLEQRQWLPSKYSCGVVSAIW